MSEVPESLATTLIVFAIIALAIFAIILMVDQ